MKFSEGIAKKFFSVEKLLYLVYATDDTHRKAWYYLLVAPEKLSEFKRKLMIGDLVLTDYGKIVASGYGEEIAPAVKDQLEKRLKKYYSDQ